MRDAWILPVILAGLLLLPGIVSADSTTLLSEDFDGPWPPLGWHVAPHESNPGNWHRAPDLGADPWADNQTPYALKYHSTSTAGVDSLISPPLNCTGIPNVILTCSTFCSMRVGPYDAVLRGSVNGGPFEYRIFDYQGLRLTGGLQTFELSWAANQPGVRLLWVFMGDEALIDHWAFDNVTVYGYPTGLGEGPEAVVRDISLLPNPASGCVNLQLPGAGPVQWRLYDAVGNLLRAEPEVGGRVVQLDLAALPSGIYFVRVAHARGKQTARLVRE